MSAFNFAEIINGRSKDMDRSKYAYSLIEGANQFGLDATFVGDIDIDRAKMAVSIVYADGTRRDGVGDLLEVGGIDLSRHQANPIHLFDHGKVVQLPIGRTVDPDTSLYTGMIDPVSKTAKDLVYFWQGKGKSFPDQGTGVAKANVKPYEHALFCEQIFQMLDDKYLNGGSIGYQVKHARELFPDYETGTPKGLHLLSVLKLESSTVVLPANGDTVRKMLAMDAIAGKPPCEYFVKSLQPYAPEKKAVVTGGFDAKATEAEWTECREKHPMGDRRMECVEGKAQPSNEIDPKKAERILKDGEVHGKPLTDKQRDMFGAAADRKSIKELRRKYKAFGRCPGKPHHAGYGSSRNRAIREGALPPGTRVIARVYMGSGLGRPHPYPEDGSRRRHAAKPGDRLTVVDWSESSGVIQLRLRNDDGVEFTDFPDHVRKGLESGSVQTKSPQKTGVWKDPKTNKWWVIDENGNNVLGPFWTMEGARSANSYQYGQKSLGEVRKKYRPVSALRKRLRKSSPGSSLVYVRAKDLDQLKQEAAVKGLKAERVGSHGDLEKVRLTGSDDMIDGMAKLYGNVKSLEGATEAKTLKKREVDEVAVKYQRALQQYGENNMATQRAEIRYRELKDQWEQQTGQKYGRMKSLEGVMETKAAAKFSIGQKVAIKEESSGALSEGKVTNRAQGSSGWFYVVTLTSGGHVNARESELVASTKGKSMSDNVKTKMVSESYEKGRNAAFDGKQEHHNPYRPVNSKEFQEWLKGYRDAKQEISGEKSMSDNVKTKALEQNNSPAPTPDSEPYGAQILRAMHKHHSDALRDYDEMLGPLEHEHVKKHVTDHLGYMEKFLSGTEKLWGKHYKDLPPLEGTEDMEEEDKDLTEDEAGEIADDLVEETEDTEPKTKDADSMEDEGVPADSRESFPDDLVEEDKEKDEKALRAKQKRLRGQYKALPNGKAKAVCPGCKKAGKAECDCKNLNGKTKIIYGDDCEGEDNDDPECRAMFAHNAKGKNHAGEYREKIAPLVAAGLGAVAGSMLGDKELSKVGEAGGYLSKLSEPESEFGEEDKFKSYHYHKTLEGMAQLDEAHDSLEDPENKVPPAEFEPGAGAKAMEAGEVTVVDSKDGKYSGEWNEASLADAKAAIASLKVSGTGHTYSIQNRDGTVVEVIKKMITKSAPSTEEWAEEEASEPAHKSCLMGASKFFKELSQTNDFGDPHRERAGQHAKALNDLAGGGQSEEEDETPPEEVVAIEPGEMGEMGEKGLDTVLKTYKEQGEMISTLSRTIERLANRLPSVV